MRIQVLWKTLFIMLVDTLLIIGSYALTILVRFDFQWSHIPVEYVRSLAPCLLVQVGVTWAVFLGRRMYRYIWRTVNAYDVLQMCLSVLLAFGLSGVCCAFLRLSLPKSIWLINLMFQLFTLVGVRCILRLWSILQNTYPRNGKSEERIMLIGAGESGRILSRELRTSPYANGRVFCVIDDNPKLRGKYLDGVRIVGGRDKIQSAVKQWGITQIIFAISTISQEEKAAILNICKMTGCRLRVLPGLYQLLNGEVRLSAVKDVQVEDLLGRTPVHLNKAAVSQFLRGKTVLVTGGGGSIGSELCRQIAACHPRLLIVLDIYENNVYDIQQELTRNFGINVNLQVEIATIRDKRRIYQIFEQYRPDVVFHAAAHKHVPLMEDCPYEAIQNNIFGTYHVVRASEKFGVKKFVMISTDKAVNPTNLMGATKRFCEMILQSRQGSSTEFCAVRFGNVLGSNGSVIPLFKQQIENGGPVTITDKRIIRYFMTISEAAMLVLEAGAMAKQSQIFVLDMGQPVKILTLAENLIRLSGLEPYKDIEIKEIGLRPGEKLYEELLMQSEHLLKTENEKIFVEEQQFIPQKDIMCGLVSLDNFVSEQRPKEELIALMRHLVPTFRDPDEVNREAVKRLEDNDGQQEMHT